MMQLPKQLMQELWHNIQVLEEKEKMRYVSSIERLCIEKGMQQGMQEGIQQGVQQGLQEGEARALRVVLAQRFGAIPAAVNDEISSATTAQIDVWLARVLTAPSLEDLFGPTQH